MPQDAESEAELKNLAAVPYQIISPANNASIIGIYQDSMLGSYRFTRENINFTKREAMNLLMMYNNVNTEAIRSGKTSNFDILSQILPPLSLKVKNKQFDGDKEDSKKTNNIIEIKDGNYLRGQIDKGILGSGTKGIIHRVCNDFGNMASSNFIDDLQNIITEYMKTSSFSVGISDLISDNKTNDEIVKVITNKKIDVKNLIDQTQLGVFENNSGKTNQEEFETKVNNILNQAASEAGKIGLKSLSTDNRFVIMVNAGSKGSDLNISQMISCLGQQNVDGKRIPYGFEDRTLPHYTKYDDSPASRGFVESSYINGLSPQELFFHAMGGRVGLIDTAVKTSSTGYIQRRLIKGLEDLMVNYDMTIRTNKNKIVQFSYGDDNFDTIKVENQELPIGEMSIQDIYAHYNLPEENKKAKTLSNMFIKPALARYRKQMEETNEKCKKYTDFILEMRDNVVKNIFNNKEEKIVRVPVAFNYIINNIIGQQSINSNSLVDITPLEAFELIENVFKQLEQIYFANPNLLFKVLYFYYLSPKDLLFNKRFNRKALEILLETIILSYKRAIIAPGEMVGMIAAQSIGEPTTQLTLNSVTYETLIIVRNRDGIIKKVSIGEFIENKIKIASKIEYFKDKDTTYAELDDYYEIPSCDEDGNILWKRIEAVTKHPVINEDGTNTMLKITTKEEREVIVTKAKSLLKLVNGKILPINGDSVKVGDYLPISKKCIDFKQTYNLILKDILPPTEYMYGSEVYKAKKVMNEYRWWTNHQGNTFTLPYTRSDSFIAKVSDQLRNGCKSKNVLKDNCIYSKQTNICDYTIPEEIPLDYNLGYLIGAYAAEGCMTKTQISISNNDVEYFKPIQELCGKWNISTKIYKTENKIKQGWISQDLRIYNTLLCRLIENLCGKLSHNKFISDKIIFSNKECLLGYLDAYIGGDGHINKKDKSIILSSVSKQLLMDTQQILNILEIYSFITKPSKVLHNNRGSKDIKQMYTLFIRNNQANKLASKLNIKLKYKQDNLSYILNLTSRYEINKNYTFIPDEIDGNIKYKERNDNEYIDVLFDQVKTIEEVSNTTNYAYDLTVEDTRNFDIYNGLALRDTFHFAGVASKSNVTRGVPRIEEILSLSAELKNPSLTVFLKPEDETDKEKAHSIMYMLEHTKLQEVVRGISICFDPDDLNTLIEEDKDTMMQYREFENLVDKCLDISELQEEVEKSKWIIRMEMDPEVMLEKNITMDDINFTLNSVYQDEITCVYSDFNSDKLIFRIRMNNILKQNASKNSALKKGKVNPLDQSDQIYILKNFQDQLLQNIVLRGIKKINKVILRKIKDNMVEKSGSYVKQEIWVLDTIGTNLLDVLGLDYIDSSRTISNDIIEIFNVLGIEAARKTIYNELADVIEFDGTYLNFHHMALLCDRMTANYKLVSIFRHGINNDNIGPIAKASFEETPEMFLKAARHAELDTMRGVSANVMCGQEGFVGTSAFQVVLDIKEMSNLEQKIKYEIQDEEQIINNDLFGKFENPDDPCSKNKLSIDNNVVNIKTEELGEENDDYNPFV